MIDTHISGNGILIEGGGAMGLIHICPLLVLE